MVWPLLAELGVALLKQDGDNREIEEQRQRAMAQARIDIMNRRAQRAGDSGYIQSALSAAQHFPTNPDNGAGMLAGVASGLLRQSTASSAEDAAKDAANKASRRGSALNDVDNLFGGRRVTDDDLLNDW
jgi:hypothetical protein